MDAPQTLSWLEVRMSELKDSVFMRPPQSMEEFNKLAGQFLAYHTTHAALKGALKSEEEAS